MTKRLENRVAIVTGSSAGIGYAIAHRLAQEGAKVVVSSRSQENVQKAVEQIKSEVPGAQVIGIACHVSKADHRKQLVEETVKAFGGIDILVNNVAVSPSPSPLATISEGIWDKLFETNVKSQLLMTQACLPYLSKSRNGSILFISSVAGYNPSAPLAAYGVTKTALIGLTKGLSQELAPSGIRVNCLAPGTIRTRFSEILWKNDSAAQIASGVTHMKRLGDATEMGGVAAFLVSDDASYITGETIVAGGGMSCHL
eukprot:TRINITY_DN60447_c0_g1_i1.p1 TRINITY_DN60447_c0_g1~~TRINITY_DN60447_c0_g1_i1.p1  ORF type:complete len:256 (+),score=39.54 TRINITY_DN60447_c0_g1_i1:22-789(+)